MASVQLFVAALAATAPPRPTLLATRRVVLTTAAAASWSSQPMQAQAINLELMVADIDAKVSERTAGDFSAALEVRPISGPQGIVKAAVELNGDGADFELIWFKNPETGKVLGTVRSVKAPKPFVLKQSFNRGALLQPMAWGSKCGLYEGDPFELLVGDYKPVSKYPGFPKGVGGASLYGDVDPDGERFLNEKGERDSAVVRAERMLRAQSEATMGSLEKKPYSTSPDLAARWAGQEIGLPERPTFKIPGSDILDCDDDGRNCKMNTKERASPGDAYLYSRNALPVQTCVAGPVPGSRVCKRE